MSNIFEKMIKRITDNYNRNENSNISKMMRLAAHHIQENEDLLQQIGDWRDIDQAEGATLDYIGRNVGQDRNGYGDDIFKSLIKAKIIKNNSDGSTPTLIRFMAFILGIEKQQIKIQEKWINGEPIGLYIEVDYAFVEALGLPFDEFGRIVNDLLSAGINADIWFRGEFMFADGDAIQEDEQHGFGEVVAGDVYHAGEFIFSSDNESQTDPAHGYASHDMGVGGRFGAYYKMFGFKDGTSDVLKPW